MIQVWELAGGKEVCRFFAEANPNLRFNLNVAPIQFIANNKQIAAVCHVFDDSADSQVLIWDAATSELVSHRLYHADIRSRATPNGGRQSSLHLHANFTPDGNGVTERTAEGLTIQDTATGRFRVTLPGVMGRPLAFSSDGRVVVAPVIGKAKEDPFDGNEWDGVRLAETLTGKEIRRLDTGEVIALDTSPDGQVLATADKTALRFWDLATGKELMKRPWPEPYRDLGVWWPANSLHFLPNGKGLVTGMHDGIILVWDVPTEARPVPEKIKDIGTKKLDGLWADLGDDPPKAYPAIHAFYQATGQAVPYLMDHLKPAPEVDSQQVQRLLAELASEQFEAREKAVQELAKLREQIEPALRKALDEKPSDEVRKRVKELLDLPRAVPSGETLRTLRAIQVLERIGSKEACEVLKKLSTGAATARETQEAKEALEQQLRNAETDRVGH